MGMTPAERKARSRAIARGEVEPMKVGRKAGERGGASVVEVGELRALLKALDRRVVALEDWRDSLTAGGVLGVRAPVRARELRSLLDGSRIAMNPAMQRFMEDRRDPSQPRAPGAAPPSVFDPGGDPGDAA